MANEYMKRCPTSLAAKEMQIKTTVRYYNILVRIKNTGNPNSGEDVEMLN